MLDGLEAHRGDHRRRALPAWVVILTTFELDEYVFEALRAGASGFLRQGHRAGRPAARASGWSPTATRCCPRRDPAAHRGVRRPRRSARHSAGLRLDELTDREREVMALVGARPDQRRDRRPARRQPATAKTHVSRAMVKLGARDRAQLVVFAYETGLVEPGGLS